MEDASLDRGGHDQVENLDVRRLLAVTVDTADPLLDTHRVPRQVVVEHRRAELEVEALRAHLRRQQDCWPGCLLKTLYEVGSVLHFRRSIELERSEERRVGKECRS